jgi:alkanesulfonate monooxygenase SsuD/methylene tetrahydromethanopterin reductase-like flavin-dependent oxidoreductase (luciferase family)
MDLVVKCWTADEFTWHGQHHTIPEPITVLPKPVQKPHPPVYVACFSEPTMRMAAERGHNIIFAPFAAGMAFGSLGQAVEKIKTMAAGYGFPEAKAKCSYFTCIVDSEEEAQRARERLHLYLTKAAVKVFPDNPETAPPHLRYFLDIVQRINALKPEDLGERSFLMGTPEQIVEQVRRVEAVGIEEIICYFNFALLPHADTLRQMERFSREVMPQVRNEALAATA